MSKMTIYKLAKELNMSPSMVSRAFNPDAKVREDKRLLVLEAAKKHGFMPNKMASRLSMDNISIGIVIRSRFAVNTEKMLLGIKRAYALLKDYKIKYELTVVDAEIATDEESISALNLYADYDGIIISGYSSERFTDAIDSLYEKNPNIVQVQAVNEQASYLFSSKHSEILAAKMAAEFIYNCLKRQRKKNVLLFTGDIESQLHANARKAFESACREYGMNLLDCIDMRDSEQYLENMLPTVFKKHGRALDAIYTTSGISESISRYIENKRLDTVFVAFDTHKAVKEYLSRGIVSASISQNVEGQMQTAFEALVKYIMTGEAPERTLYTDTHLMLKSNMGLFE